MALSVTSGMQAAIDSDRWDFVTLVQIDISAKGKLADPRTIGATLYLTDKSGIRVDGIGYAKRLLDVGAATKSATADPQTNTQTGNITITVDNTRAGDDANDAASKDKPYMSRFFRKANSSRVLEGHECKVYWTARRNGTMLPLSSAFSMMEGVIEHCGPYDRETAVLTVRDISRYYGDVPLLKTLRSEELPTLPAKSAGAVLPLIMGWAERVPLIPIDVGFELQLLDDITDAATECKLVGSDLALISTNKSFRVNDELIRILSFTPTTITRQTASVTCTIARAQSFKADAFASGETSPPGYPPSATLARPHKAGSTCFEVGTWKFAAGSKIDPREYVYACASHPLDDGCIEQVQVDQGGVIVEIPEFSEIKPAVRQWTFTRENTDYSIYDGTDTVFHPPTISFAYRQMKIKGIEIKTAHLHTDSFSLSGSDVNDSSTMERYATGGSLAADGRDGNETTNTTLAAAGGTKTVLFPSTDQGTVAAVLLHVVISDPSTTNNIKLDVTWDQHGTGTTGAISNLTAVPMHLKIAASAPIDNWDVDVTLDVPATYDTVTIHDVWTTIEYTVGNTNSHAVTGEVDATANTEIVANEFVEVDVTRDAYVRYNKGIYNHWTGPAGDALTAAGFTGNMDTPVGAVLYAARMAGVPMAPAPSAPPANRIDWASFKKAKQRHVDSVVDEGGIYRFDSPILEQVTLNEFMARAQFHSVTFYYWEKGSIRAYFLEKAKVLDTTITSKPQLTEAHEAGGRMSIDRLPMEYLITKAAPHFGAAFTENRRGQRDPKHRLQDFGQSRIWYSREMKQLFGTIEPTDDRFHFDLFGDQEWVQPCIDHTIRTYISHYGGFKRIITFPTDARLMELEMFDLVTVRYKSRLPDGRTVIWDDLDGTINRNPVTRPGSSLFQVRNISHQPGTAKVVLTLFEILRTSIVRFDPLTGAEAEGVIE